MQANTMNLDFDAATNSVTGTGSILGLITVPYTGTYNHPDFTLEGSFRSSDLPTMKYGT